MHNDRAILVTALQPAVAKYADKKKGKTLLGATPPDDEVLEPLSAAIEKCRVYQAVAGHALFSADSGIVITAPTLAIHLIYRAERDIPEAADWLLRVLTTRQATGLFKVAIWGLSVEQELRLSETIRLIPFEQLGDSDVKSRILHRAQSLWENLSWISQSYYDVPRAALVSEVPNFPFIGARPNTRAFKTLEKLVKEAEALWVLLEAACVGHPLAFAYWFEYADRDLDLASWENSASWGLPEIVPHIRTCTPVDPNLVLEIQREFSALPAEWRNDLLRSMRRFTLSQCRYEMIDRVLDLALSFEVPFSNKGDNAPIGWKVGLRAAQLIGGTLEARQESRRKINELYKLRNKGAHGSSLKEWTRKQNETILQEATDIYRVLVRSFLRHRRKPDWEALELEPSVNG
jgi:hypothetical protein